jgi:hypothetical protein
MRTCFIVLGCAGDCDGAAKLPSQTSGPTLKKAAEFDLPGPPGERFDYLRIDPDDHYLISAHLAVKQTYVIVIDLATNKVAAASQIHRAWSASNMCRSATSPRRTPTTTPSAW